MLIPSITNAQLTPEQERQVEYMMRLYIANLVFPVDTTDLKIVSAQFSQFVKNNQTPGSGVTTSVDSLAHVYYTAYATLVAARLLASDSSRLAKAAAGDSARKIVNDSLKNSTSITNKMLLASVDDSLRNADSVKTRALKVTGKITLNVGTDTVAGANKLRRDISDSLKLNTYLMIPFERFFVDTSKTISVGTARSDTINYYQDFKGDTTINVIATDDSSYGRYQNLAIRASIYLDSNVVAVDTVCFWFRTKFSVRDSNKLCFYAGEQSRWTWSIAYTDSLADTNNVSWTKINLKPTGLIGGDILSIMIRGYCKGKNFNYFGNCYAVLRRK